MESIVSFVKESGRIPARGYEFNVLLTFQKDIIAAIFCKLSRRTSYIPLNQNAKSVWVYLKRSPTVNHIDLTFFANQCNFYLLKYLTQCFNQFPHIFGTDLVLNMHNNMIGLMVSLRNWQFQVRYNRSTGYLGHAVEKLPAGEQTPLVFTEIGNPAVNIKDSNTSSKIYV